MGKAVKEDKESLGEEVKDYIKKFYATKDVEIAEAEVSLYRIAEQSEEKKILLIDEECFVDKIINLMVNECLSIKRVACMILCSLSAAENHFYQHQKKYPGFFDFILCYIQNETDDIVIENTLSLLLHISQRRTTIKYLLHSGFLLPLLTFTSHHDPDIVKLALHFLTVISKDFQAKKSMANLNVTEQLKHHLDSHFFRIKKLWLALLQTLVKHHLMREKFVEEGLLEILMEFVKNNLPAPRPPPNQLENRGNVENNDNNSNKLKKKSVEKVEQEELVEKSPAEKRLEENQWLIPHCLFVVHKLLMVPIAVEKFVELCGIQLMLDLIDENRYEIKSVELDKKTDKKEDKNDKKKPLSRAASKLKKNKEEDTIEEKDEREEEERENAHLEQVHIVTAVADCLSLALASGNCFESIMCQNIEERYFNFLLTTTPTSITLPLEPSITYQTSIISFLAVLAINPASKPIIAQHEGFEAILNKCSTDDFDLAHAISLLLANLANCSQPNCILLTEEENLKRLLQLFESGHEFTLVNVTQTITKLSLHSLPRAKLTNAPVFKCIMDLLARQLNKTGKKFSSPEINTSSNHDGLETKLPFIESDILIKSCLMALQGLCVDLEGRQLMKGEDLSMFLGLMECHCVEVQTEAALLLHHISHQPDIAQDLCQQGGLRIAFESDKSAGGCNQVLKLLLDQLFKYNLVAKLAYQGFLGDDDKVPDGFIDVGRMKKDEWIEMTDISAFFPLQDSSQRPVYLINPVAKVPTNDEEEKEEEEEREKLKLKTSSKKLNKKKSQSKLEKKSVEKTFDEETTNSAKSRSSQQNLLFDNDVFYDVSLYELIEECLKNVLPLPTTNHQVEALAKVVSERLGGQVFKENLKNFEWEDHIREFMKNNDSGLVPLGVLKWGIHHHRALLFKTLADRLLIPCSLITCDYGRSFILTTLMQPTIYIDVNCKKMEQLVAVRFVVDLIYQPGLLIPHPSEKARAYYSF